MSLPLVAAAVLTVLIGFAHSWLGERYLISRLLRRSDLPHLFGSDVFTRHTLRFAWHLTTIAWGGLAGVLLLLSGVFGTLDVARGVVLICALTFAASALLSVVFTQARHLSWVVFAAITALCVWVAL